MSSFPVCTPAVWAEPVFQGLICKERENTWGSEMRCCMLKPIFIGSIDAPPKQRTHSIFLLEKTPSSVAQS